MRKLAGALLAVLATLTVAACAPAAPPPDTSAIVSEARDLDLAGQHDAAIARYREALALDSSSYDAHYGVARALDLAGRYDEAREHFSRALELTPEPTRDQTLRMLAISRTFAGDVEEAARHFRDVFDRRLAAGNFPGASEVANELGRVYLEFGDLDRAEEWYGQGHDVAGREEGRPDWQVRLADIRWAHAQARIAARRGQADEARRHQAAVGALLDQGGNDDQRVQYAYLRGYVAYHLKEHEAAIAHLREADQEDPFILLLLAQATEAGGDMDAAREYYRQVLTSSSHAVTNAFARPVARQKLGAP